MRFSTIDFSTQPVHVYLDEIRKRIEVFIPDVFGDLRAADHSPGIPREVLEQRVLFRRELDFFIAARHAMRGSVDGQISNMQRRRSADRRPPLQRANASKQLCEGKRLDEVVVRAAIEAGDAIFDRVASRQHQHRRRQFC